MRDDKHPPWRWAGVTYQVLLARYSLPRGPANSIRTDYVNFSSHQISHTGLDDIALACLSYLTSLESHLLIICTWKVRFQLEVPAPPTLSFNIHYMRLYPSCQVTFHLLVPKLSHPDRDRVESARKPRASEGPDLVKDLS